MTNDSQSISMHHTMLSTSADQYDALQPPSFAGPLASTMRSDENVADSLAVYVADTVPAYATDITSAQSLLDAAFDSAIDRYYDK